METEKKYQTLGNYTLLKTLGTGYSSKVKLAQSHVDKQFYAIKILKKNLMNQQTTRNALTEINTLKELSHPNIVNIVEAVDNADYLKKNDKIDKVLYIVIELAPGGELFDFISVTGRFSEQDARFYFQQLIDSLEYIHQKGFAHRDLKPENLLFSRDFNLKMADFGFSAYLSGHDGSGLLKTVLGTESYMAPEIHVKLPYSGIKVDIFAAGIILFIMVAGTPPFSRAKPEDPYYRLIINNKFDTFWGAHSRNKPGNTQFFSMEFRNLINQMISCNPNQRPSIDDIKLHQWFNGSISTHSEIVQAFSERLKKIEFARQQAKFKKDSEKIAAASLLQQQQQQGILGGHKINYRNHSENQDSTNLTREILSQYPMFNAKREESYYYFESDDRCGHCIVSTDNSQNILRDILVKLNNEYSVQLSKNKFKIYAKQISDEETLKFKIKIQKIDEKNNCITFKKEKGSQFSFLKVVQDFRIQFYGEEDEQVEEDQEQLF